MRKKKRTAVLLRSLLRPLYEPAYVIASNPWQLTSRMRIPHIRALLRLRLRVLVPITLRGRRLGGDVLVVVWVRIAGLESGAYGVQR